MTTPPLGFDTRAIHGRIRKWPTSEATAALTSPIYETSSFAIRSLKDAIEIVARGGATFQTGEDYVYSRGGNPTTRALEGRLAELEEGADSIVFGSGMAALTAITTTLLGTGDHAIVTSGCFGDSYHLFKNDLARVGVSSSFVDTADLQQVAHAIRKETKLVLVETPANPTLSIADISGIVKICKTAGVKTIIDSTFASPYLQRPLTHGCDVVVHSLTKYISGHGDALGGAIFTSDLQILADVRAKLITTGAVLDPFAAFLILRGIETMSLRVRQHCLSALKVAKALAKHPQVTKVYYPGLIDHPEHELAKRQMRSFGGVIAFEVRGGRPAVERMLAKLRLCTFAVSLGSTKTLVEFPAGMTHKIISSDIRQEMGITDGLVRISIGLEDVNDILADILQALGGRKIGFND
jgi:methionine-gamma-lyase